MAKKAAQCYYKILRGFIQNSSHGNLSRVFTIFIKKYGLSKPTLGKMLVHYLCMENHVDGALRLIHELKSNNLKLNFPVDVIRILSEQGRSLDAFKILMDAQSDIPTINVVDYSILVDRLCKEGYIEKALQLCSSAQNRGVTLNVVTYNSLFNGLCRQSCLVEAFRLFDSLERNNIIISEFTYGILIDALVREGFLFDARQLFERMVLTNIKPNIHIYNSLIDGYCKSGNVEEGLRLLYDLEKSSVVPDKFTISAVLYGFSLEGNMEAALEFFINMKENGFPPDFLGFLYLVRGLCTKGRMEETRSILREMLQDQSVVELINRVNVEIEMESIDSFLLNLCEQGNIQGVLDILNEIGAMFFPYKRNVASGGQKPAVTCDEDLQAISRNPLSSVHPMDFDGLYSQMASLCSQGNIQGATSLARDMISSFAKN